MKARCRIGLHKWKPLYTPRKDEDRYVVALFGRHEWIGYICADCLKRKPAPEGGIDGNYD